MEMILLIPVQDIAAAGGVVALFVLAVVQMCKSLTPAGREMPGPAKAVIAMLTGPAVAITHYCVAWPRSGEAFFYAVLVGVVGSAVAMGVWTTALKGVIESQGQDDHES